MRVCHHREQTPLLPRASQDVRLPASGWWKGSQPSTGACCMGGEERIQEDPTHPGGRWLEKTTRLRTRPPEQGHCVCVCRIEREGV